MELQTQKVYVIVKVQDKKPEFPINIGLIGGRIPIMVNHYGNGKFKSVATSEKPIEVDEYLFPEERIVFSKEEFDLFLKNFKEKILKEYKSNNSEDEIIRNGDLRNPDILH